MREYVSTKEGPETLRYVGFDVGDKALLMDMFETNASKTYKFYSKLQNKSNFIWLIFMKNALHYLNVVMNVVRTLQIKV